MAVEKKCQKGECGHGLARGIRVKDLLKADGPYKPVNRPMPVRRGR